MEPNTTSTTTPDVTVTIMPSTAGGPSGKLADAEIRFTAGVLAGLKLVGFAIWERRTDAGRYVTFPARQYAVNGEQRRFALLRPTDEAGAQQPLRDAILAAYAAHHAAV